MKFRTERLAIALIVATALSIAFLPTIAAVYFTPRNWSWTGILSRNTADLNGYLSMVEEIRQDGVRTRNLLTGEPHPRFQIRPIFILLGLAGKAMPAVSGVALMEAGRFLSALLLLFVLYRVATRIGSNDRENIVSLLVLVFGTGLGWLHLTPDPPDLRIVETATFLAFLSPALYLISLALLLTVLLNIVRCWEATDYRSALPASLVAAFAVLWLGLDRPFSVATIAVAVTAAWIVISIRERRLNMEKIARILPVAAGASAAIAYQWMSIRNIDVYAEWNRQHVLPTPDPIRLILAAGLLLPLAIAGTGPLLRRAPYLAILSSCYVVASVSLAHLPFPFQERFLEGAPACLAVLAASGLLSLRRKIAVPTARIAFTGITIAVLTPSIFGAILRDIDALAQIRPPQYLPNDMFQAMEQLKRISNSEETVLSARPTGNFIPAYTGRPVVVGHQIQTADFLRKQELVLRLFQLPANHPEMPRLLQQSGASWLFWGPEERWIASGVFRPDECPYLNPEFRNQAVTLYRIHPADPAVTAEKSL